MALYLIGLGLDGKGISIHGKTLIRNCRNVYLENYTVNFPYTKKVLEKVLKVKLKDADREFVEGDGLVKLAKNQTVCLLIYGSPLSATTHISLLNDCKKARVKYKVVYAGSVFDAIAESGLSLYKFGKVTSLPRWQKNFTPKSFMEVIKDNQKIGAHTLILIDIGLKFDDAREQLKKSGFKEEVIVCSQLGIKPKFEAGNLDKINAGKVKAPWCLIVPSV
ncbi:MAG: diphthine synthase [Nanoarchaeota archaeon]|nr:diphthine synthase [Nanoarchaeota archaeon]